MASEEREKMPGLAILLGGGKPKGKTSGDGDESHDEPDADQKGGKSDGDADNVPAGALAAYKEHKTAEAEGDDEAACAALLRMCKLGGA